MKQEDILTFPHYFPDQRRHAANKESRRRFESSRASEKVGGEVWQIRRAPNSFGLRRDRDRRRGLLSDIGSKRGIDCSVQRRAVV